MPRERVGGHFRRKTQTDDYTKPPGVGVNASAKGEGPDVFARMEIKTSKRQLVEKKKTISKRRRGEKVPVKKIDEAGGKNPSEVSKLHKRIEGREPVVSDQAITKIVDRLVLEGKPFSELLEDPEAAAWLEEFVARVATGEKRSRDGAFSKVSAFFEGGALPKDILYHLGNLLGIEFEDKFGWKSEGKPVDLATVERQTGLNEEQVKFLLALVVLLDGRNAIHTVVEDAKEGKYKFLEDKLDVTRAEADRISAIEPLANKEQFVKIIEALLKKVGRAITEKLSGDKLVNFLNDLHLDFSSFNGVLDFKIFENILGEDGKLKLRNEINARGARGFDVLLSVVVRYYEEIFGKLTKEEFLVLVPNAQEAVAADFSGKDLKKRFGLDASQQVEPKVRSEKSEGGKEGQKEKFPAEKVYEGKKVQVVKERELLQLRAEANRSVEAPQYLFPPTVETKQLPGRKAPEARVAGLLPGETPPVLRVPLDRRMLAEQYAGEIEAGLRQMQREHSMPSRVEVFLTDVWPQFLLARAQAVEIVSLEDSLADALELLPNSVRIDFGKLIALSKDTKNNAQEIRRAAQSVRNNSDLHNQGVYVWTELIARTRQGIKGSEDVDILTAQSHHLDAIRDLELESGPTRILYAGKRLDRVDRDYPAMGVNVKGDGQGVVFLEQVKNYVAHEIVPYLADSARLVVPEGKEIHPLHALKQEALRSEHGSGKAVNGEEVYKKAVWSTTVHEARHEDDRRKGRGGHPVEMEYTAYLTSIATPGEDGKPNQPLTDLIAVIDLYHNNVAGLGRLGDMFGVNEGAAQEILLGLAGKFGMGDLVNAEVLKNNHLDVCAAILQKAIEVGGEKVQKMAQELIDEYYVMPTLAEKALAAQGQPPEVIAPKPEQPSEKVLPQVSAKLVKPVRGLPEHHVRPALTAGSKREKKPGRSLLNKLRETVFFTGLAAVLGIIASQKGSEQPLPITDKENPISLIDEEKNEMLEAEDLTRSVETSVADEQTETNALEHKGLWGYAEAKLNAAGFTKQMARDAHAYSAAVNVLSNRCRTLLEESQQFGFKAGETAEEAENLERKITPAKARELQTFLAGQLLDVDVQLVIEAHK